MDIQIELDNLYQLTHQQRADICHCCLKNVISLANENGVVAADEIESVINSTIDFSLNALTKHQTVST